MFGFNFVISLLHLRLNPQSKRVADYGIDCVRDVLSWQLLDLLFDRKISSDLRISIGEVLHVLDSQTLELRNIEVLDLLALNPFLRSRLDISKMPDSNVFEGW